MKISIVKKIVLFICMIPFVITGCKEDDETSPTQETESVDKVFDGNASLTSQAQVNDFAAESYNIIDGNVLIGFDANSTQMSDITSLNALSSIRAIGGSLSISNNPVLPNIEGLNTLNFVRGLEFRNNALITTLAPLINVLELTFLHVEDNDALRNLEGLNGVTTIQQFVIIKQNAEMLNLNGLNNLDAIEDGLFNVSENSVLSNISALSNLEFVGGSLSINFTPLTNLSGLDNLATLEGDMFFNFNAQLNNYCALNNLVLQNVFSNQLNTIGNAYNPVLQDIVDGNCNN